MTRQARASALRSIRAARRDLLERQAPDSPLIVWGRVYALCHALDREARAIRRNLA